MNPALDPTQLPLRDIHLPEAIGWWPPAVGWWLLAGVLLVGVAVWALRHRAGWRQRVALAELTAALAALRAGGDPALCAQRFSITLKRFAMTLSDRPERVAGLAGEPWLAYLDSRWEREAFSQGAGRGLLSAPWVAAGRLDRERCLELGVLCQAWIKAQRAGRFQARKAGGWKTSMKSVVDMNGQNRLAKFVVRNRSNVGGLGAAARPGAGIKEL